MRFYVNGLLNFATHWSATLEVVPVEYY